jgi:hypothetical protein
MGEFKRHFASCSKRWMEIEHDVLAYRLATILTAVSRLRCPDCAENPPYTKMVLTAPSTGSVRQNELIPFGRISNKNLKHVLTREKTGLSKLLDLMCRQKVTLSLHISQHDVFNFCDNFFFRQLSPSYLIIKFIFETLCSKLSVM